MDAVSEQQLREVVLTAYGFDVTTIKPLPGYEDLNYHVCVTEEYKNEYISTVSREGYVLKVLNRENSTRIDFIKSTHDLINHLAEHGIPVPRLTPTLKGDLICSTLLPDDRETPRLVSMYQYIQGVQMDKTPVMYIDNVLTQVGELAGRVDKAIKTFNLPDLKSCQTIWGFESVPDLAEFVEKYCTGDDRTVLLDVIQMYKDKVLPVMGVLQKGFIHGDLAPHNILLRPDPSGSSGGHEVVGLIDFGDSSESCYVFEIACTVAHTLRMFQNDSRVSVISVCRTIVQAYLNEFALLDEERRIFQLTVCTRFLQLYAIGLDTLARDPYNTYVRAHTEGNIEMIRKIASISAEEYLSSVFNKSI